MKRRHALLMLSFVVFVVGCVSPGETNTDADAAAPATSGTSASPQRTRSTSKESLRVEKPLLAENEVRLPLVVIPADAIVEVDDALVRRRHGAVEIVGKVGDERRVRVFVGATSVEKVVKIDAVGLVPSMIELGSPP